MRAYAQHSVLAAEELTLELAPALTPTGVDDQPIFFKGFMKYPQILSRGLLVLADITSTRYYHYTPAALRDPILSAQGDRLRAECFSACNGVYARLDLLESGFDGKIGFGTTNVDIGPELRTSLTRVNQKDRLHISIGGDGLTAARMTHKNKKHIQLEENVHEHPVQMPDRWVRALGNAAEIHERMKPVFTLKKSQAQMFVTTLPPVTGKNQAGWLMPSKTGAKLSPRQTAGAVYVSGLHRLTALKRIMTNLVSLTFYSPRDEEAGHCLVEAELPHARLTLGLTAEAWQGYSGEGALLEALAKQHVLADVEIISKNLAFSSVINELELSRQSEISEDRVRAALALLAVSGKLGYDAHDQAYFHRELPNDPDRVLKDNPRLKAAKNLLDAVTQVNENQWLVHSNDSDYRVSFDLLAGSQEAKCTCPWYLKHQNERGPCKHILAVQLKEENR